jgi:ADP-L-glycero-D-manno-heptose 6-epimerase
MSGAVLITGAAGFIGARYAEACAARGETLVSVDERRHFGARPEHRGIDFGEIVDRDKLFDWLRARKPRLSAIVHMGAITDTTELDEEKLRRLNLEYSKSLWSHAAREGVPFVYASSAATYGAGELGYDDDEKLIPRLKPLNPYGESKRLFDLWALEEEAAGRKPPAWSGFKFFNVYGFGERHKGSMASVALHAFDQIRATGRARLFRSHRADVRDGEQKRDFILVDDVVRVLDFARSGGRIRRGIYNLGTGRARTFLDLARAVFAALGKPEQVEFIDTPEAIRDRYQYFTEARMERLRAAGYGEAFTALEAGVGAYVTRLSSEG